MQKFYLVIKHSHLLFAAITLLLFNLRFWLRWRQPGKSLPKLLRILPHINDTLLLFTGLMLMVAGKWPLFGSGAWLGWKLLAVAVYIGFGFICFKNPPRSLQACSAYAAALLAALSVVWIGHCKLVLACSLFSGWSF